MLYIGGKPRPSECVFKGLAFLVSVRLRTNFICSLIVGPLHKFISPINYYQKNGLCRHSRLPGKNSLFSEMGRIFTNGFPSYRSVMIPFIYLSLIKLLEDSDCGKGILQRDSTLQPAATTLGWNDCATDWFLSHAVTTPGAE